MITQQFSVDLNTRSYPVYLGANSASSFAPKCIEHNIPKSIVIVTDANVARVHLQPLTKNLVHYGFDVQHIVIPAGEQQKSLHRADAVYTELLKRRVERKSAILALGGGVVGDLAGFIAATYQRGIQLIQVPTTLLAQVDSAIGGKVGINHPLGKNMIGAFYQPAFVWEDAAYLETLPFREIICGLGEIVKYGIIRDETLFAFLEAHLDALLRCSREETLFAQSRCVAIKADVVSKDEYEQSIRIILNCGHTIGHALESAGKYRVLKHGEAVLLGLAAESYCACKSGILKVEHLDRITALIRRIPIKGKINSLKIQTIVPAIDFDKKRVGKKTRFVLPTDIGATIVVDEVDKKLVRESLKFLFSLYR